MRYGYNGLLGDLLLQAICKYVHESFLVATQVFFQRSILVHVTLLFQVAPKISPRLVQLGSTPNRRTARVVGLVSLMIHGLDFGFVETFPSPYSIPDSLLKLLAEI